MDFKTLSSLSIPKMGTGALLEPVQFPLHILQEIPGGSVSQEGVLQVFYLGLAPGHPILALVETAFDGIKEDPRF